MPTRTQRIPVKHNKTFSGCWTCRSRHLKCGEEKPECQRCIKAGLQCQGYAVKLVWTNSDGQAEQQNIRRSQELNPYLTLQPLPVCKRVDQVLRELDQVYPGSKERISGPFSVFSTISSEQTISEANTSPELEPDFVEDFAEYLDIEDVLTSPAVSDITALARADQHNNSSWGVLPGSPTNSKLTDFWDVLSRYRSNSVSLDFKPPSPTNSLIRHLDILPRPAEQKLLLHHWTNFLCWHLVPVDMSDNPFRSVLTPIAMSGIMSPASQSNGQIALFHAICATSAFSRAQLLDNDARTLLLAMKHYQLAVTHLRHTLANPSDSHRQAILATIMMFSAMDMITGRSSEWRTHLEGGVSWLSTTSPASWGQDRSSAVVYQSYLAIAALCNITVPGQLDIEPHNWLDSRFYCLDRFFGLSRQTLQHIMQMNSLVNQISSSTSDTNTLSTTQLHELEQQLLLHDPETLDLSDLSHKPLLQTLSRHHAYVFYYASLIFFRRSLLHTPPSDSSIQSIVTQAVDHLESIERLGREVIGCTLVWPPFVVACECTEPDMQERMVKWYETKKRHGFMNLWLSLGIAKEVWKRRAEKRVFVMDHGAQDGNECEDVQWQDVLADMKMDIVLA